MLIRPLGPSDAGRGFSCGVASLDHYFRRHAHANQSADIARCYVLTTEGADAPILGYYTLSTRSVEPTALSSLLAGDLPRFPLPVLYLGRFAVAEAAQGRGRGRLLLGDALRRCLAVADVVGAVGVFLESYDARSTGFYAQLGFAAVGRDVSPLPMFLPMATLRRAVEP